MTINLHIPEKAEHLRPTITVVGVGGAGGNAVNNMISSALEGVNFVVANTDAQALDNSLTERTIQLGAGVTKGLGAGANPNVGREAAEEAAEEIAAYVEGSNMVFITAGMGGGTGTGAASVVARIAKEQGMLTVAVVTKPFQFEGKHRMCLAEEGLKELQSYVDTLIVIPNQNLFRIANEKTTFADAFKMADEVLHSGVRGVTDLMVKPGLINLDFSDIRTVMREMGKAMMGTGESSGEHRAVEAAEAAISNPLLDDVSLNGARALLVNVTGGLDMTLFEVDEALNRVREEVDVDANIIFGSTFNDNMEGKMRVSVVATGIDAVTKKEDEKKTPAANDTKKPYSFGSSTKPEPIKAPQRIASFESTREFISATPRPQFEQLAGGATAKFERPSEPTAQRQPERQTESHAPHISEHKQQGTLASASRTNSVVNAPVTIPDPVSGNIPSRQQPPMRAVAPAAVHREAIEPIREAAISARGFFKRMAEAGRALSSRRDEDEYSDEDEYQEPVERQPVHEKQMQVIQKTPQPVDSSERSRKTPEDDQYLDIPAFLRRQAN